MDNSITLSLPDVHQLSVDVLLAHGLSPEHAESVANVITAGQRDECDSHGIYRLPGCVKLINSGKLNPKAVPEITDLTPAVVRVDAKLGYSTLCFDMALPLLAEKAAKTGIAALIINNCYHFSALWPEVEAMAEKGLVSIALTQGTNCVAPAGGSKPTMGTNPIAFAWPRPGGTPFVFDFATSAIARGDVEIHELEKKNIPLGWAVDSDGKPTTDPSAALKGALLAFGGHKGSALSIMVELLAGPMIGDLTSAESWVHDEGLGVTPLHGEMIIVLDPKVFLGDQLDSHFARAETLFESITAQGARLPSQRRYEARKRSQEHGVKIPKYLYDQIQTLLPAKS